MRWKLRSDPESAAEAVMWHWLECATAVSTGVGVGGTWQHKGRAYIEAAELSCAALCLSCPGLHSKCYDQEEQCSLSAERDKGFGGCHYFVFFQTLCISKHFVFWRSCVLFLWRWGPFYTWSWMIRSVSLHESSNLHIRFTTFMAK